MSNKDCTAMSDEALDAWRKRRAKHLMSCTP